MMRVSGTIDDAINAMVKNGWMLLEKLGPRGNRDEWVIMQDVNGPLGLFSMMTGRTVDGNVETVVMFEKQVSRQGRLF